MALKVMEKDFAEDIPIVVLTSTDIVSYIKAKDTTFINVCGHQLYKNSCMEKLNQITLSISMLSPLKRKEK